MRALPRRVAYGLIGALLAVGAPAGLVALRAVRGGHALELGFVAGEIARDPSLYLYMLLSTLVVFGLFGCALGSQADRLARLSVSDPLTGLLNARAFSERLRAECARAARYSEPLSLLLIDVDGLKDLNDRQGHAAGDAALRQVASAVESGSRASDTIARWGGDEFAVIAPNTAAAAAEHMAERIRALVALGSPGAGVTVSVGVVTWSEDARRCRPERLRERADAALYEAKRSGRNRVRSLAQADADTLEETP